MFTLELITRYNNVIACLPNTYIPVNVEVQSARNFCSLSPSLTWNFEIPDVIIIVELHYGAVIDQIFLSSLKSSQVFLSI